MTGPRLRDSDGPPRGPYPLGQIPDSVLIEVGKQVVHRLAVGHSDIDGDDFARIFANAINGGTALPRPIGIADVLWNGCAWSCKTVKLGKPFRARRVRLISGRNSPEYSVGITNPHLDPQATGRAVLSIWNQRVNLALGECEDLRAVVFIRNPVTREFVIFEYAPHRFVPDDYVWEVKQANRRSNPNFIGRDRIGDKHCFTWQPHGSQFTIIQDVPGSTRRFAIERNVPIVEPTAILAHIQFRESWISIRE